MKTYISELVIVTNRNTGNKRFYCVLCGTMSRISKQEFDNRYEHADGIDCIYDRNDKHYTRSYRTTIHRIN